MNADYTACLEIPSVDDYLRLRRNAGLTARSPTAAAAGLPRTVAGVVVRSGEEVGGMGRAVGDGLFYQIVDIAVEPEYQGRGVGRLIIARLMDALQREAPASIGMAQWING